MKTTMANDKVEEAKAVILTYVGGAATDDQVRALGFVVEHGDRTDVFAAYGFIACKLLGVSDVTEFCGGEIYRATDYGVRGDRRYVDATVEGWPAVGEDNG